MPDDPYTAAAAAAAERAAEQVELARLRQMEAAAEGRQVVAELFGRMDKMDGHLERIEAQGERTNGRVTALEQWQHTIDLWRAELKGIAQGSGGVGRLLFYLLAATAAGSATIVGTITIVSHIK